MIVCPIPSFGRSVFGWDGLQGLSDHGARLHLLGPERGHGQLDKWSCSRMSISTSGRKAGL